MQLVKRRHHCSHTFAFTHCHCSSTFAFTLKNSFNQAVSFWVIIVKAYDRAQKGPVIVFSADLYHGSFPGDNRYFVIGTPSDAIKPDLSFSHDDVSFKAKYKQDGTRKITEYFTHANVIPEGDAYPMAVILLKEENRKAASGISLLKIQSRDPKSHRSMPIVDKLVTEELEQIINSYIVDIVIYSRRSEFNRCPILYRLCDVLVAAEEMLGPNYCYELLPGAEWDHPGRTELSLNKCPSSVSEERSPFAFTQWKLGKPTPHRNNDCDGPHFIIQKYLEEHGKRDIGQPIVDAESGCSGVNVWITDEDDVRNFMDVAAAASTSTSSGDVSACVYEPQPEEKQYSGSEQAEQACVRSKLDHDIVRLSNLLEQVLQKQKDEPQSPVRKKPNLETTKPWEDTTNFSLSWLAQIKEYHKQLAHLITHERKPWLQYFHVPEDVPQSFFRCRFCYSYIKNHPTFPRQFGNV